MENQGISNNPKPRPSGTKRIEFIDAMRGFTIFLVVLFHVAFFCLNMSLDCPSLTKYAPQVHLPMFFLISGFVMYKEGVVWSPGYVVDFLKKKISVLLLAPLLFFLVYMHVNGIPFTDGFFHEPKYGYWFTFVLFIYYVLYACVRFCLRGCWADIALVSIGVFLLPSGWQGFISKIPVSEDYLWFFSFSHWQFFLFFVLGSLIRKYYFRVQQWIDGNWLLPVSILFYLIGNSVSDVIPLPNAIMGLPLTLTGLVIMFSFFRKKQDLFSHKTWLGRALQLVGQRTLDIYLIHFFLLPVNLSFVTVFVDHPMPIIEFFVSSLLSLIIIAMCLLISNIIRLSPFLAHWIFGVKKA